MRKLIHLKCDKEKLECKKHLIFIKFSIKQDINGMEPTEPK
jgi:hypothetical protein